MLRFDRKQQNSVKQLSLNKKQILKNLQEKETKKRQNIYLMRSYKLLRKEEKGKGEKERYTHLNAEFQGITRRDNKTLLSDQCKEIEEHNRMKSLEISSRKIELSRE